ncbi:hypothetical protein Poli38472_000155 [Pythium oligandrum]|uniref:Uncharacterized protein n=1 Tax=Pythium oligandrum TaxID=41045 RepID=A0A8K1CCG8_PYTOL|nr:hypothetical protein Poli38472_000155 [Pythium oligandrum]|eukprot:TMW60113.1 hypothetical protein Poli38472_000155 [Pythium oligandrum]
MEAEIARLKSECHAKDETLNQLKLKTKSFVDNLRNELAGEKKKVAELVEQLKTASGGGNGAHSDEEVAALKKEIATVTQHENELKARAKTFADSMKAQLQTEKDKVHKLEKELEEKMAALASAATNAASSDLLGFGDTSNKDAEIEELKIKLQGVEQETSGLRDQLRQAEERAKQASQDARQAQDALQSHQTSSDAQIAQLQAELRQIQSHEKDLESSKGSTEAAFGQEHSQLESTMRQNQTLSDQIQQYKIENEHLQKQVADKDFQLELLDSYRRRAEEAEDQGNALRAQASELQMRVSAQQEESAKACAQSVDLERQLSEMTSLYERVNMGRSQSDLQLAEAQTTIKSLEGARDRVDDVNKQNMQLNEKIFQKESEVNALKEDVKRLTSQVKELNDRLDTSKSDSFNRKQQSESLEVAKKQAEDAAKDLLAKAAALEKRNHELTASVEAVTKDSNEKRQKAKVLVIALTNEKQSLVDAKSELQKEVDRLRMELNQKNVENERRLKQVQEENQQRISQSTANIQNLNDEISTLKQTLLVIQESERNQQRAKELANAKREVEDANKKRLAAKSETQKLAVELENVQKCLHQLADNATSSCTSSVKKLNNAQERVNEALAVLEKRASASGKKPQPSSPRGGYRTVEVEDLRGPEAVKPISPTSGARKVEDNLTRLTDKLNAMLEVTDKLCDLSIEQNDVNLKDVVIDKVTQLFTQCFSEKLRAAYAKVDDGESTKS